MAIEILDTYLPAPLASGGTITFAYPAGRSAASYLPVDEVLMLPASGVTVNDPVVTYGASNITLTYTGAPLARNTKVRLQVTVLGVQPANDAIEVLAEDYGAVANGVTNDATALNNAATVAWLRGGGIVKLRPGATYFISTRIDNLSNVQVVGYNTTIRHNGQPFRANGTTGGGFYGITFEQVGVTGQGLLQAATGFEIERCKFLNQVSSIAITTTSTRCRVAFCEFTNGGSTAVELNGSGVNDNDILFNRFTNNVGFGIWITGGANDNLIQGNRTAQNGLELIGITYDAFGNRLIGNKAEGCGDNGISVTGYRNVLAGNITRGNAFHGLCLYGSRNVVTSHHATNNGTAGAGYAGVAFSAAFGGIASFNAVSGLVAYDDQATPTQSHNWKVNAGAYTAHGSGQSVSIGAYRTAAGKLYRATTAGTTGATPLTHTSGTASDGAVTWQYLDTFGNSSLEPSGNVIDGEVLGAALTSSTLDSSVQKGIRFGDSPHPGYIGTKQYTLWDGATQNAALAAADTIYFYAWYNPRRITFASGALRVATGGAGSSCKVGIWANSTLHGRPVGAPIAADNTGFATTGTGQIAAAIAGALEPGWYWIGVKCTGTPPSIVSTAGVLGGGAMPNGGNNSATQISFADTYSNSMPTLAEGASFTPISSGGAPILGVLT